MKQTIFYITENEKILHDEMLDLDSFIYKISGYFFKNDLQFEFVTFDPNKNVANYDEVLENSLYTLITLNNSASDETRDIIEFALRKSEETGKIIRPFFHNSRSTLESIDLVKRNLADSMIIYDTYDTLDEIKMDILYQIKKLAVPKMKLEFNQEMIKVNDEEGYVKPFNIPFFRNFRNLEESVNERNRLNIECKKMAQRFLTLFSGSYEKPKEFQEATVKRDQLTDQLTIDEDAALQVYIAIKSMSGQEDPEVYVHVRDYFDNGNIEELNNIDDLDSFVKKKKRK
jgi:hypothetical protein